MNWTVFAADARLAPDARGVPQRRPHKQMKLLGFLLLLAGWGIVLSALVMLTREAARTAFVMAGIGVEVTGLFLVVRAHPAPQGIED
jgi:hypothetical protein